MLSEATHLALSVTYEDEILRLLPQDDIPQSRGGRRKSYPHTKISSREV
jgi:hypothetical protein